MKTKEEVREYIDSELGSSDGISDYSELDSLAKLDLIMKCEGEYIIAIGESELEKSRHWTTNEFVDYVVEKINKKENDTEGI